MVVRRGVVVAQKVRQHLFTKHAERLVVGDEGGQLTRRVDEVSYGLEGTRRGQW